MNTYIMMDNNQTVTFSYIQLSQFQDVIGACIIKNRKNDIKNKSRSLLKQTNIPYANVASNPATWKTQCTQFIFLIEHCTVQIGNLQHIEQGSLN